ncbi:uncharacterized protein LOC117119927 [Anneissia japonica]|uniref:uncharacterized protein LOC117119927 n=1 Tax=Anneissia japonica TaxID=1529436 RepID=UPI001425AA37|nr:uncharacterized protein LOC117119927 [Anneissia japonica]
MSGGCCGSTSAKVASIILIITGIITFIAGIVWTALLPIYFIGIPLIIGGAMFIAEGVLGLMFVYNAKNRCWMVTVNVVSIIVMVVSAVGIGGCTFLAVPTIALRVDCNDCDPTDSSCNDECGIAFSFIIITYTFMILVSLVSFATSIVLIVSSCTCRKSNMGSAPI